MSSFPVDIFVQVFSFGTDFKTRNLSKNADIAFWITLDSKYINKENKEILENHKTHLNQRDIPTLIKCMEIQMPITPVLYIQDIDQVKVLLKSAMECGNIECIDKINNEYGLHNICTKKKITEYVMNCCICGKYPLLKWFYEVLGLRKEYFDIKYNNLCMGACSNGHLEVFEYLHTVFGYTKEEIQHNDDVLVVSAARGHLHFIKYLHENVGFTAEDFWVDDSAAWRHATLYCHEEVATYLCVMAICHGILP